METTSLLLEMIITILTCIVFRFYASASGAKDAMIYGKKGADSLPGNEHVIFFIERLFVVELILLSFFIGFKFQHPEVLIAITINFVLGFSFWHNGFYYIYRGKIDKTYSGFKSNSTTSTSIFEFN